MFEWLQRILGEAHTEEINKAIADEIGKRFVSKADFEAKQETIRDLNQRQTRFQGRG